MTKTTKTANEKTAEKTSAKGTTKARKPPTEKGATALVVAARWRRSEPF